MLKTRVKTAAVLVIAAWELYGVCGYPRKSIPFVLSLGIAGALPFLPLPDYALALAVIFPLTVLLFALEARDLTRFALFGRGTAFVFSLAISLLFKAFPLLREGPNGLYRFLLPIAVCVVTDTAAYFVGRALGKHKLAPKISPGKSVEGAVGGTLGALVLTGAIAAIVAACGGPAPRWVALLLYALTASLLGQAGDLSLSVLKRITGVKDYGKLMPGHGGVLDRFDSMLFAVPYTLLFLRLFPVFAG